ANKRRVGRKRCAAVFDYVVDCDQPAVIVVVKAAWLVIEDLLERRRSVGYRQNLIDLLLVLCCHKLCLGVSENKSKFVSHCIRVNRNWNRAQRLRGHDGPVELGPIGAHDRDLVSWLHAKSRQARGISMHDLGNLGPGPRLPYAKILVPKRRTSAELRGIS